ncbi:MAG TPA: hypothetical protein VL728_03795 [Cyclobacteriaceae bacterium]|nr:hypothetical protein [Cyclobacteriaceae bacterium]
MRAKTELKLNIPSGIERGILRKYKIRPITKTQMIIRGTMRDMPSPNQRQRLISKRYVWLTMKQRKASLTNKMVRWEVMEPVPDASKLATI